MKQVGGLSDSGLTQEQHAMKSKFGAGMQNQSCC